MAALHDQLRQMHRDLRALAQTDSEQEVTGRAFTMLDAVLAEARLRLPPESTLRSQIEEFITPDAVAGGEDVEVPRAADAAVLVGQILAALDYYERGADSFPAIAGYRANGEPLQTITRAFEHAGGVVPGLQVVMNGCARGLNVVRWRSLGGGVEVGIAPYNYAPESHPRESIEVIDRGTQGVWRDSWCLQPVFFYASGQDGPSNLTDVAIAAQFYLASPS